jgi:hypothetical protein
MSTPLAQLLIVTGPGGGRVQAVFMCACGSLEVVARSMCAPCLARQHRDREYFEGHREAVLDRDRWTCQGMLLSSGAEKESQIPSRVPVWTCR